MAEESEIEAWYLSSLEELRKKFEIDRKKTKKINVLEDKYFDDLYSLRKRYLSRSHDAISKKIKKGIFDETPLQKPPNDEKEEENPFRKSRDYTFYHQLKASLDIKRFKLHIVYHNFMKKSGIGYIFWLLLRHVKSFFRALGDYHEFISSGLKSDMHEVSTAMQTFFKNVFTFLAKFYKTILVFISKFKMKKKEVKKEDDKADK